MKYLGIIAITLMIVEFAEPIKWVKQWLGIDAESDPKQLGKQILRKLFNCALCTGFWVALVCTFSIYEASVMAFASELTYRLIKRIYERI